METFSKLSPETGSSLKVEEEENKGKSDTNMSQDGDLFSQLNVFSILPELWDQILNNLSPTDFLAIINSSLQWRNMFKTKTTDLLLPLVLNVLLKHWAVSKKSVLNWRQVNRKAKLFIEGRLEESPQQFYKNRDHDQDMDLSMWSSKRQVRNQPLGEIIEKIKNRYDFKYPSEMEQFTSRLATTGLSNPFLTKSLSVFILDQRYRSDKHLDLDPILMNMMSKFGHGISTMTFDLAGVNISYFFSLLGHISNLKVLKMNGPFILFPEYEDEMLMDREWANLKHLEILDIEKFRENMRPQNSRTGGLCTALLGRCCTQLKILICSNDFFGIEGNVNLLNSTSLPNLRCLRVSKADASVFTVLSEIKGLHLAEMQFVNCWDRDVHTIGSVIRAVDNFSQTLTHLQLFFKLDKGDVNLMLQESNWTKVLPKLSAFTTYWQNVDTSWFNSFIQHKCQNLKVLSLHGNYFVEENKMFKRTVKIVSQLKLQKVVFCCEIEQRKHSKAKNPVSNGTWY
ncbi:hypothetical protein Ocin01_16614 [Orchesella cincta]|uniref:F-box domain-containing protein n=1 Tax=Orchesella cincta TaxID=48709 RepID=A0A1D2MAP6_ORCCI|nr:hypothetical protein Ocin01_16614 [Orchesella cincta]